MNAVRLVSAVAVALVLTMGAVAGCTGDPSGDPTATPRIGCTGLPAEKCDEAVASVARSLPNEHPVAIDVTCANPPCTAASGAMDTIVTLADGRRLTGATQVWSDPTASDAVGAPLPVPADPGVPLPVEPVCLGVAPASCRDMAASFIDGDRTHGAVVSIVVRCTSNPCTERSGEGDATITYADGTTSNGSWGYSGGG